jgi:hypothetical protein
MYADSKAAPGGTMVKALRNALGASDGSIEAWADWTAPFDPNEGFALSELLKECDTLETAVAAAVTESSEADTARACTIDFLREHYGGPAGAADPSGAAADQSSADQSSANQSWRRIDHDWLGLSADLGIQLDKRTNNSSLVLAFEFTDSKRVMLFVGDAQVGNWLSWKDVNWKIEDKTVSAHDLLARTVFYKVGHHGSHNATLKAKGLELMVSPDLSAFVPTNQVDAQNVDWGQMPFGTLLDDLRVRSHERVIRADDPWLKTQNGEPGVAPSGSIKAVRYDRSGRGLWVELDIA